MRRARRPDLPVADGERLLAWTTAEDGTVLGGTRDAVYLPERLAWEDVEAADWDSETSTFRISEVGRWGDPRRVRTFTVEEPGRFLELVRERVTASVVLQRHVPVRGRRGMRVIARRPPGRHDDLRWVYEYDEGIDPDDPEVRRLAAEALAAAQREVGGL